VACAQTFLETVSEIAGKTAGVAGTLPTGSQAERDLGTIIAAAMRAAELLASVAGRLSRRGGGGVDSSFTGGANRKGIQPTHL